MNNKSAFGLLCFALISILVSGCASHYGNPYPLMRCDPMPDPSEAVCGKDGVNYQSACLADEAGVQVAYPGICGMRGSVSHLYDFTPCEEHRMPNTPDYIIKGNGTYYDYCKEDGSAVISYYCQNSRMGVIESRCEGICNEMYAACVIE